MNEAASLTEGGTWTVAQQLGVQVTAVLISIIYAAVLTLILMVLVDKIIGFRSPAKNEMQGLDASYHGEHGYGMLNAS